MWRDYAHGRCVMSMSDRAGSRERAVWQSYRAPTPEACFDVLENDLSALPMLRRALLELLDELPSHKTGLGSTEMRLLALLARGYAYHASLCAHVGLGYPSIFAEFEVGSLLEGLAQGPNPRSEEHTSELQSRFD